MNRKSFIPLTNNWTNTSSWKYNVCNKRKNSKLILDMAFGRVFMVGLILRLKNYSIGMISGLHLKTLQFDHKYYSLILIIPIFGGKVNKYDIKIKQFFYAYGLQIF